jgi:hypothetical protein
VSRFAGVRFAFGPVSVGKHPTAEFQGFSPSDDYEE